MELINSVIVITGAASGIGEAAAIALSEAGAKVVLADLNEKKLADLALSITNKGHHAVYTLCDVTQEASVKNMFDFAVAAYQQINIVLASAGIIRDSFLVTPDKETGKVKKFMTAEQWQSVIDVNLTGVFYTLREAAIKMIDNGWKGVLIPLSSINKTGELGQLNYASTKAAIALWPKIIAGEFFARGINNIRIAAIAPGYVATPILTSIKEDILKKIVADIPLGRLVATNEIIDTIKFIVENEAVHATTIEVSGGIIAKGLSK
jgi:3-oxoacyl-[acyl-carrier protein] reductase